MSLATLPASLCHSFAVTHTEQPRLANAQHEVESTVDMGYIADTCPIPRRSKFDEPFQGSRSWCSERLHRDRLAREAGLVYAPERGTLDRDAGPDSPISTSRGALSSTQESALFDSGECSLQFWTNRPRSSMDHHENGCTPLFCAENHKSLDSVTWDPVTSALSHVIPRVSRVWHECGPSGEERMGQPPRGMARAVCCQLTE